MAKKATIEDFKKWIEKLGSSVEYLNNMQSNDMVAGSRTMCVTISTYLNVYRINVVYREHDNGWMSCCVPSRHLSGDTWSREDKTFTCGEFTRKTWDKILQEIVAFEVNKITQLH